MDDEWNDDSDVDAEDWGEDDGPTPTVSCKNCGHDMYEDVVACPICGHYAVERRPGISGQPIWYLLLAGLGIVAVIVALAGLTDWL